ncbi:unnamed protein product [Fusarium venenatum]|uniref:Uncharacterized protein n=1 Tax=Fusarium venenatum TaxID=56646 RepID=A0A2L2SR01_9HYPO|nr:uncharacterized protein FVRRES_11972 [Fusarium venenatum]CEI39281.1 unnamed protein product [Fusarium venenatum]
MVREDLFLWPNGRGRRLLSRYAALVILAAGRLSDYLMCILQFQHRTMLGNDGQFYLLFETATSNILRDSSVAVRQ